MLASGCPILPVVLPLVPAIPVENASLPGAGAWLVLGSLLPQSHSFSSLEMLRSLGSLGPGDPFLLEVILVIHRVRVGPEPLVSPPWPALPIGSFKQGTLCLFPEAER